MSRLAPNRLPRMLRSVIAGASGTTVFTLGYMLERRVHHTPSGDPLDFDDSDVPGEIVANVLHLGQLSEHADHELGTALRWGYGSAFGVWHGVLRRRMGEPWATAAFGMTLLTATATLFPLLGRTPPPWRWPPGYVGVCVATHAAYAVTVGVVDSALAPTPPASAALLADVASFAAAPRS